MTILKLRDFEFKLLYPNADKKLARKWVAELRNPKRQQTTGRLRGDKGGMCCLGVLCDVIDSSRWENTPEQGWIYSAPNHPPKMGSLPEEYGLRLLGTIHTTMDDLRQVPLIEDEDGKFQYYAVDLNDSYNFTFAEIAQVVEVVFGLI